MLRRTWILFGARLAMARRGGGPIPALLFLSALAAGLALLVRDLLPAFPYAFFALATGALVLGPPLLSDLGAILRQDPGLEWLAALPARATERTLARVLHLGLLLAALVGAWCAPFALLAPEAFGLAARLGLPALALAQGLGLAALLIWAQQLFLARAQALFVLFETALFAGLVIALLALLGRLPELARLTPDAAAIAWLPPAWFATAVVRGGGALVVPAIVCLASVGALLAVPASEQRPGVRRGAFERALEPLRRLARRLWVREEERGAFELVFAALPREREVALRTLPMLGIPLAFLLLGASGAQAPGDAWRGDVLALLLFTVGIYLPLLLTHVPLSETPEAAWILRLAPRTSEALVRGTIKALFVRWLLPLYLGLLILGLALGQGGLIARLWLPATLLGLLLLRALYPRCVRGLPLSKAPDELRVEIDWAGLLSTLAVALTLLAVLANRFLSWPMGLAFALLLAVAERVLSARPSARG
ncbi:MAG: hypothetical protein EXS08_02635 [Planctomycetes bacterium]|nr:hypothetical protein [Planctomycetota bacterium]